MTYTETMKALDTYLQYAQSGFTERSYRWCLERLATWMDEQAIQPDSLTPETFTRFLDEHSTWGESTRRLAACAARAFYRYIYGATHPMLGYKLRRVKTKPQRTLSIKKIVQLLSVIDTSTQSGARDLAIMYLMLDTGLRESEVCNLETHYLDLEARTVHVIVKGGNWGKAVFSETTAKHLETWLTVRKTIIDTAKYRPSPRLFISLRTGQKLLPAGLRDMFERLSKKVGFRVSPHDLRRTFATLATRAGAPTRVLMAGGRWSNIATLERYTAAIEPEDFENYFPTKLLS